MLDFFSKLLRDKQIDERKDDGFVELFPRLGSLSQRRCLVGSKKILMCFARIDPRSLGS